MQIEQFVSIRNAIDSAKLAESWEKVKNLLDDLVGIFESTADPQLTKPLKCYFCVSSAEYTFHNNNDLTLTVDSLRRAYAFQNDNEQLRIVAMRVLLITCRSSVNVFSTRQDPTQHYRHVTYKGEDLSLQSTLGERLRDVSSDIVGKVDSVLHGFTKIERCCIVTILETFPVKEIVAIIKLFHNHMSLKEPAYDMSSLKRDLVLIIARHFLPSCTVALVYEQFLSGQISCYNYWLVLDSIITRATIAEIFDDIDTAILLLRSIVELHESIDMSHMEERCIDQILLSVAKLPLLYGKRKLYEESWSLLNKCVYEDGAWSSFFPMKVKIGLSMKAALQCISIHENDHSPLTRDNTIRAGEYLAHIWHVLNTDKFAQTDALTQSSFTSRMLLSPKISCVNVLPDDDTNIPYVAKNFDVAHVGILLAAIIHHAHLYFDMRLTPSIFLSREYESTFLSYNVHQTMHEIIEWGYQLSLKPSCSAIWNMASSCLRHSKDSQRAAELMFRCHTQMLKTLQQYCVDHEIKVLHLSPMETAHVYTDVLRHVSSLEDLEISKSLQLLMFPVPQRFLVDPWSALNKYAEIVLSHVCAVTGESYHQTGFTHHWSPSQAELESAIEHVLSGVRLFTGRILTDNVLTRIGVVENSLARTLQTLVHTQPLQEGLSKQLFVHGLQSYFDSVSTLPAEMQELSNDFVQQRYIDIKIQNHTDSAQTSNPSNRNSVDIDEEYTAVLGILTLILQLGRLMFHYSLHVLVPERVAFALQQMSGKLIHIVFMAIEPFIHVPMKGNIHQSGLLTHFNSAENLLAHDNPRYTEFIEVKMTSAMYLSMLFLELRLPHLASKLSREMLQSPYRHHYRGWMKVELRFLHILSLAVSASDEGDDPKKLAVAIALLQKVIGTSVLFGSAANNQDSHAELLTGPPPTLPAPSEPLFLNERYSILLLILQSGERKLALTIADRLVHDMHILIQRHNYEEMHYQNIAQDPTGDAVRATTNSSQDTFTQIPFLATMFPDVMFHNDMMVKLVKLLRQVAVVAVNLEKLTLAKQAVAIAWKSLYTVDAATTVRLQNLSKNDDANMKKKASKSLESLAKTHDEIDALRYLPTLLGWRLPEGYGWGCEHHRDLEASLLCTCARIAQQESGRIDETRAVGLLHLALSHDPRHVETLNALANVSLALYEKDILRKGNPSLTMDLAAHLTEDGREDNSLINSSYSTKNNESFYVKEETLLSSGGVAILDPEDMADVSTLPNQHLLDMETSYAYLSEHFPQLASPHLASALFYVRSALAIQERNADSWQLLSAIQRALQLGEFSEEAAITSLECQVNVPVRQSVSVLW